MKQEISVFEALVKGAIIRCPKHRVPIHKESNGQVVCQSRPAGGVGPCFAALNVNPYIWELFVPKREVRRWVSQPVSENATLYLTVDDAQAACAEGYFATSVYLHSQTEPVLIPVGVGEGTRNG